MIAWALTYVLHSTVADPARGWALARTPMGPRAAGPRRDLEVRARSARC